MDAVSLDFWAAFETVYVPHERLLQQLYGYGVKGKQLGWISDFTYGKTETTENFQAWRMQQADYHKAVLNCIRHQRQLFSN